MSTRSFRTSHLHQARYIVIVVLTFVLTRLMYFMLYIVAFVLSRVVAAVVQFPSQVAFPVTQPSNRTEGQWITIDSNSNVLFTGKLSVPNEDGDPYIVQMNQFLEVQWQVSLAEINQQYKSFSATGIASLPSSGGPNGGYVVTGTKNDGSKDYDMLVHIKLDAGGNFEREQTLSDATVGSEKGSIYPSKPIADQDGNVFITGTVLYFLPCMSSMYRLIETLIFFLSFVARCNHCKKSTRGKSKQHPMVDYH
jgi:hypothetical protein